MKNKVNHRIYEIGGKIGLNNRDLDLVLKDCTVMQKQFSYSIDYGPDDTPYWASFYGTISIKDF